MSALLGFVIETVIVDVFFELAYIIISTMRMAMSKQKVQQIYDGIHWNVKFVTSIYLSLKVVSDDCLQ